jgi:chemotaxis protein CheD
VTTCLFDPVAGVGGMNHILLPTVHAPRAGNPHLRFGLDAIDRLIHELTRVGAFAPRLLAKVFGGGHVINAIASQFSPGDRIVEGVLARLQHLRIPVVGQDTGGIWTRVVQFHTDSFHVLVRKTASGHSQVLATEEDRVRRSLEPVGSSF